MCGAGSCVLGAGACGVRGGVVCVVGASWRAGDATVHDPTRDDLSEQGDLPDRGRDARGETATAPRAPRRAGRRRPESVAARATDRVLPREEAIVRGEVWGDEDATRPR